MHLIADVENLLLNPLPAIEACLRSALAEMDCAPASDECLNWVVNVPFSDAAMTLLGTSDSQRLDAFMARYQRHFACKGRYAFGVYPGSRQAMTAIKADDDVQVHYLTHIGPRMAKSLIDHYGFADVVDSIFTASGPQCRMARPGLLQTLCEQLRTRTDAPLAFASDDPAELDLARRLGLHTIGLLYGRVARPLIERAAPDALATSPRCLPRVMQAATAEPSLAGAH